MDKKNKKDFDPSSFEPKWQEKWEEEGVYQPNLKNAKKPFYNLMMFPYPSAEGLHVGNMYAFTGADIYGRFKRMQGHDVFEPIGLDGFGIHSENYAIKIGKHPVEQAKVSQENFYRQLSRIGNSFAWDNRLETYNPNYYRWTQWLFIKMFKNGLAYRKSAAVNWCLSCKTVLADEQVENGICERCKSEVEKREMQQWFFKITEYAQRLLDNLTKIKWPHKITIAQKNWIGRKEGINIQYQIEGIDATVTCFTTRPDTNFGATFVVLGPEHKLVAQLLTNSKFKMQNSKLKEIKTYVENAKNKSEIERLAEGRKKTGVFTDLYCINDLNGYKMPIYISDFVLGHVGTGAVVGVPGHDKRDFEFAQEFEIPVKRVVVANDGDDSEITKIEQVQEEEGRMVNSEFLNGLDIHKATQRIMDHMEEKGMGKRVVKYKLRDWCISRQRYWGPPIPMIYCKSCASAGRSWENPKSEIRNPKQIQNPNVQNSKQDEKIGNSPQSGAGWFSVPEDQLPVTLPHVADYKPTGDGKSPLEKAPKEWLYTKCPKCGGKAKRETDVSDTFLDSAWYFLQYPSVGLVSSPRDLPWNPEITKRWLPVNAYIGGAEHAVLHLLYARFVTMALHDFGYLDFEEPFPFLFSHGLIIKDGAKMSKSRGNVVTPDEYIQKYGSDTLRCYLMFVGPYDQGGGFRDTGVAGMQRFLKRVWQLVIKNNDIVLVEERDSRDVQRAIHHVIKEVTDDIENLRYNTAIAHMMEFVNVLREKTKGNVKRAKGGIGCAQWNLAMDTLLKLLAPFAPFMTEELFQRLVAKGVRPLGNSRSDPSRQSVVFSSIHVQQWPEYDPKILESDEVTIVIQVNGKLRATLQVKSQNLHQVGGQAKVKSEVEKLAKASEKVQKYLKAKKVKKTIFVPGKLINFVTI